ncbi:hypothetical protein CI102_13252 [Trichoderma harzianum]|uniref:Uncharacterized protein n=1 Tax=Trichoderma harzianum CBS 226.95 TaxID=983964 RepID=A0A2T3ZYN3_TRIHA|nr:hypothetical protein M431DRAFT_269327 [Trichoderma harzianum CBS 226.95]PKK43415.1 hypothetical protein CI102_13252 [Trichoderma harzianum]PTB49925.1 hypothetical protein M431DRAFT_269327 [Trichoderma harzianum CBS 226.95]
MHKSNVPCFQTSEILQQRGPAPRTAAPGTPTPRHPGQGPRISSSLVIHPCSTNRYSYILVHVSIDAADSTRLRPTAADCLRVWADALPERLLDSLPSVLLLVLSLSSLGHQPRANHLTASPEKNQKVAKRPRWNQAKSDWIGHLALAWGTT